STSPIFSEAGIRGVMNRAGVRALLSKPLIGRTGDLMGVITVHFQNTHKFDEHELQTVKHFARQAADLIEHHRMRTKQKQGEEVIRLASEAKDEFLGDAGTRAAKSTDANNAIAGAFKPSRRGEQS